MRPERADSPVSSRGGKQYTRGERGQSEEDNGVGFYPPMHPGRGTDPLLPISYRRTALPSVTKAAMGAFLVAAALDVVASLAQLEPWAVHAFRGATLLLVVGVGLASYAAVRGRTENARHLLMLTVTLAAAVDLGLRASSVWSTDHPDGVVLVLSIAIANLVALGAMFEGALIDEPKVVHSRSHAAAARPREKRLVLLRADELWARWQIDVTHRTN
jgi:hypothetical protein